MKLYVGNLPYQASESDLENWFKEAGISVDSVNVMRDRFSGEARGFGFVEINNEQDAARAISTCNGKQFMGRALVVNEARPLNAAGGAGAGGGRGPRGGGGGGGRGGRGHERGGRY
jgi:cold-inducible RNA-binding protein